MNAAVNQSTGVCQKPTDKTDMARDHSYRWERQITRFILGVLLALIVLWMPPVQASNAEIRIEGLADPLLENARAHLSGISLDCHAPEWQARLVLHQTGKAVREALNALGHYKPMITPTLERSGACWLIYLKVNPGPPVRITALNLHLSGPGQQDPDLRMAMAGSGLKVGMTLDQGLYSALKNQLEQEARAKGFFDAHFTRHSILVNPQTDSAVVTLDFETGTRYRFGPTQIEVHSVKPTLVKGFLTYHQGEAYSSAAVIESQNVLTASRYFDNVRLVTDIQARSHGEVPMRLVTTPARRYQLLMGAGYSSDTGPTIRLDFRDRRLNRAGHRYATNLQLSRVQSQATILYEIPLANPRTDWLSLEGGYQYQNTLTSQSRIWKLSAARTHMLGNGWLRRLSLTYMNENSSIAGTSLSGHYLMPGIGLSRTVARPPIYPQRGWSLSSSLTGAARGVIATTNFIQGKLGMHAITPLWGGLVLTRAAFGATVITDVSSLPASLRFFAGGAQSVRGYGYETLGPTNAQGVVVGGRYQIIGSVEYDHHLTGQFYWALFYDAGNAFDHWPFVVHRGAGFGIRWHSPLGPIRLDIGRALNPLPGAGLYTLQVSMGPAL